MRQTGAHLSGIFRNADRDGSGSISAPELEGALRQFGFPLSPQLVQTLTRKFGESTDPRAES